MQDGVLELTRPQFHSSLPPHHLDQTPTSNGLEEMKSVCILHIHPIQNELILTLDYAGLKINGNTEM